MLKKIWMKSIEATIDHTPSFRGKGWLFQFPTYPCIDEPIRTAYGVKLKCRLHDYTNRAAVFGHYGRDVANVAEALPPGSVFIDIGANAGLFSSIAARAVGRSGTIIAFEPQPELYRLLFDNLTINGADNPMVFNLAVASATETITMSAYNPKHSGLAHRDLSGQTRRVRAVNIDTDLPVIAEVIAGRHTTIKIDVEGAELEALNGITQLVQAPTTQTVIVEIDPDHLARFDATTDAVYDFMAQAGFEPTSPSRFELTHYDEIFRRRS